MCVCGGSDPPSTDEVVNVDLTLRWSLQPIATASGADLVVLSSHRCRRRRDVLLQLQSSVFVPGVLV